MAPSPKSPRGPQHSWRFWAVFPGLCFCMLLVGLDTSIVATALPTIVSEFHSGALYIWVINGYSLTTAAIQPVSGQAADIFGRRIPLVLCISMFTLGSGICGGASSTAMLIAGRLVQGLGGGGLFVMVDIIVCDLVPLRYRQIYGSIIGATFALGTFVGPVIGGVIVTDISWRWVFYLNVPIAGVALTLVLLFLRLQHKREGTLRSRLAKIDLPGNVLLMASIVAILIGLTWGGTSYRWNSWHVLVPLLLGIVGFGAFLVHQRYYAAQPVIPVRIYSQTTSALAYTLTFLHGIEMAWLSFFLPIYYQVLLEATPLKSGIDLLAVVIPLMPAGIAGGFIIAHTGHYKPTMILGFVLLSIGAGCLTTLTATSSTAEWVIFGFTAGAGGGFALTATLPAVQAPLPESDVATATASWGFVRSFGMIWGAAIPAAIFNSRIDSLLHTISDPAIREILKDGGAYEHATASFITSFNDSPALKQELVAIYTTGMKEVWQVLIAFAVVAVPIACFVEEVPLRKTLVTEFGLTEDERQAPDEISADATASGHDNEMEENLELQSR